MFRPSLVAPSPRRLLIFALLALALCLTPAAQTVPLAVAQSSVTVTARPASGPVGTVFRFRGTGFTSHETVSTVVKWPDGTEEADVLFQANGDGVVEFIWDSKGAVVGGYTATATGADSKLKGTASFSVQ